MRLDQQQPSQTRRGSGQRRARQLEERMRRDHRLRLQEIHERAEREVLPMNDSEPPPRID